MRSVWSARFEASGYVAPRARALKTPEAVGLTKKRHSPFANRTNGQTPCGSMQTNQPLGHAQNNPTCVSILSSPIRARGLQPHRSPAAQHPFLLRYRRDMHEALDATREGSAGAVLWGKKQGEPLESGVLKAYFCSCVFDARGHLITIPRSFASGYYLRAALRA